LTVGPLYLTDACPLSTTLKVKVSLYSALYLTDACPLSTTQI